MYKEIANNKRKSALLIFVFMVLVGGAVWAFSYMMNWGPAGIVLAIAIAGGSALVSYWKSDTVALSMSRAVPADPQQYLQLHNLVEGLAIAAGIPKPRVYIVNDPAPNAFATGRNPQHSAIAVTTGLLEIMNRDELEGVLAHELSHIKDYDILVSTIAVTMVGVVALLADWGLRSMFWGGGKRRDDNNGGGQAALILAVVAVVFLVLSPLIAVLMQAAVSRRRESMADVEGVHLTRHPQGLISALEKLRDNTSVVHTASRATAHLWIESPLARDKEEGGGVWLNNLYDTHPPLDDRIAVLKKIEGTGEIEGNSD